METRKPPAGWKVEIFELNGDSFRDYHVVDKYTIFSLVQTGFPNNHVWLEICRGKKYGYFNVCRSDDRRKDFLYPSIKSASEGVEYCYMIADKYINTKLGDIPGTKKALDGVLCDLLETAKGQNI